MFYKDLVKLKLIMLERRQSMKFKENNINNNYINSGMGNEELGESKNNEKRQQVFSRRRTRI